MAAIDRFREKYAFLSNFHPSQVGMDGLIYPTVEHAYQAAKTLNPGLRTAIRTAGTPGYAKQMGRAVKLREDWESVKLDVMLDLLRRKFSHDDFRKQLLATGDATLIEGNDWGDHFWGMSGYHPNRKGLNHLGRLLMQVRSELRAKANKFADVEDLI